MKNPFNLKKITNLVTPPQVSVSTIHEEIDSLEGDFLNEVNEILASPILETKEERKANLAKELGFVNSSIVKEGCNSL